MTLPTISSDNVDSPGPRAPLTSGVFFSPGPNDEGFHFKEEGTYLAGADLNASHVRGQRKAFLNLIHVFSCQHTRPSRPL